MSRLEEIQARVEAATEGPWQHISTGTGIRGGGHYDFITLPPGRGIIVERGTCGSQADIEFMCAAREDVPWLIERLRELEAFTRDGRLLVSALLSKLGGSAVLTDTDLLNAPGTFEFSDDRANHTTTFRSRGAAE